MTQLTILMKNWSSLPLVWMGRITVIKISIWPKIAYPFRTLPIQVPAHFLCILLCKVAQFIWGKLKPYLPQLILYTPRTRGGLSVPNFSKYYYAAQLAQLPKYHAIKAIPLWVLSESVDCTPLFSKSPMAHTCTLPHNLKSSHQT